MFYVDAPLSIYLTPPFKVHATAIISETKLNESFPEAQLKIPSFTTSFQRDQNKFGGGIMVFVREDIFSKLISNKTLNIERISVELTFCKKKWLLSCSYNPNMSTITDHLEILDLYSAEYENIIIIGDFDTDINHACIKSFCETYTLSSHIKEPRRPFMYKFDFDKLPL